MRRESVLLSVLFVAGAAYACWVEPNAAIAVGFLLWPLGFVLMVIEWVGNVNERLGDRV
jgi:hypothetical protein